MAQITVLGALMAMALSAQTIPPGPTRMVALFVSGVVLGVALYSIHLYDGLD